MAERAQPPARNRRSFIGDFVVSRAPYGYVVRCALRAGHGRGPEWAYVADAVTLVDAARLAHRLAHGRGVAVWFDNGTGHELLPAPSSLWTRSALAAFPVASEWLAEILSLSHLELIAAALAPLI
jgi:hypothetical protein